MAPPPTVRAFLFEADGIFGRDRRRAVRPRVECVTWRRLLSLHRARMDFSGRTGGTAGPPSLLIVGSWTWSSPSHADLKGPIPRAAVREARLPADHHGLHASERSGNVGECQEAGVLGKEVPRGR